MAIYIKDLEYTLHSVKNVTHQLRIETTPDIPNIRSKLRISILRSNSGEEKDSDTYAVKITVNGEVIKNTESERSRALKKQGSDEIGITETYITHGPDGKANFSVELDFKCDYWAGWGVFSQFWTLGSASISGNLTPINTEVPTITDFSISADRYGYNAQTAFVAKHSEYPLTEIKFTLSGLTYEQVNNRVGKVTQADESKRTAQADGTYSLVLTKTNSLTAENSILLDLNGITAAYPLDSGKSYKYSLVVTAQNNKTAEETGTLYVPQKVTGITCDSSLDISLNTTEQLAWSVEPSNAQVPDVVFTSSDTSVATIDESGIITAVSNGICEIQATTVDGNYSAVCAVNVIDTSVFPLLEPVTDYLSVSYLSRIIFACSFVFDELTAAGAAVEDLTVISLQGRQQPIIKIYPVFVSIEENCQKLRAAAVSAGIDITALPPEAQTIPKQNLNWVMVINTWISFLNELHAKINGGD